MGETLRNRRILAVDDEKDVLEVIKEELDPYGVNLDTASSYQEGVSKLSSNKYDLVILDIMGVRGFELLEIAAPKEIVVVILTAHALSVETLSKSINMAAAAYLSKDRLAALAPFLEDALTLDYQDAWNALLKKMGGSFGRRFGPEWKQMEKEIPQRFEK
jgi:CheY-like chemotaxis protein